MKIVKLTENDVKYLVEECINKLIISEGYFDDDDFEDDEPDDVEGLMRVDDKTGETVLGFDKDMFVKNVKTSGLTAGNNFIKKIKEFEYGDASWNSSPGLDAVRLKKYRDENGNIVESDNEFVASIKVPKNKKTGFGIGEKSLNPKFKSDVEKLFKTNVSDFISKRSIGRTKTSPIIITDKDKGILSRKFWFIKFSFIENN